MANDVSNILPVLVGQAALVLRENAVMAQLVARDYSKKAEEPGNQILVPVSAVKTASDITPAEVPPAPSSTTPTSVPITLDKWKKADFTITEREYRELSDPNSNYISPELKEAVRAVANQINSDIFALYKNVYGYVGTAETTPFGSTTPADIISVRQMLNNQLCPVDDRKFVLNADAEAAALGLTAFQYANQAGTDSINRLGNLGTRFGFDFHSTTTNPTHTKGTAATITVASNTTINQKVATLKVASGTGTLVVGDVLTFAGDAQTYVVTAVAGTLDTTGVVVSINPALKTAPVATTVVTLKGTHVVNLAFVPAAFQLAMRPSLVNSLGNNNGTQSIQYTDPQTGLPLRIDVMTQYHQTTFEVSTLYGVACVRPEMAVRLAG